MAEELELPGGIGAFQGFQEQSPEAGAEDLDRQQEFAAAPNPPVVIRRQAAAGNDAVQVGMKVQIPAPSVEHREEARFHPQALGVAGNREQRLGGGAEEDVVDGL